MTLNLNLNDLIYSVAERHRVVVYGTMLTGKRNHDRLRRNSAVFIGEVLTEPKFAMMIKYGIGHIGYLAPVAITGGQDRIQGELYEIDGRGLLELDLAEGHPGAYQRTRVNLSNGSTAWMYIVRNRGLSSFSAGPTHISRAGNVVRFIG